MAAQATSLRLYRLSIFWGILEVERTIGPATHLAAVLCDFLRWLDKELPNAGIRGQHSWPLRPLLQIER